MNANCSRLENIWDVWWCGSKTSAEVLNGNTVNQGFFSHNIGSMNNEGTMHITAEIGEHQKRKIHHLCTSLHDAAWLPINSRLVVYMEIRKNRFYKWYSQLLVRHFMDMQHQMATSDPFRHYSIADTIQHALLFIEEMKIITTWSRWLKALDWAMRLISSASLSS